MKITFIDTAWEDYLWFQEMDKKLLKRINLIIKDIQRNPLEGIGKPEPLKANLSGYSCLLDKFSYNTTNKRAKTRKTGK